MIEKILAYFLGPKCDSTLAGSSAWPALHCKYRAGHTCWHASKGSTIRWGNRNERTLEED